MPTIEVASMANNLPRKMASIGTAAAMTSMTLFDFSSISWDSSMPASRMVRKNSSNCPICAVSDAVLAERAGRAATLVTGERRACLRLRGAGAGDDQPKLPGGRSVGVDRADQVRVDRGRRSARRGPAGLADGEQPLLLRGEIGFRRRSATSWTTDASPNASAKPIAGRRQAARNRPEAIDGDHRLLGLAGDLRADAAEHRRRAAAGTTGRAGRTGRPWTTPSR